MNFIDGAEAQRHGAAAIGVRPEHLHLSPTEGSWRGKVDLSEHLGSDTFLHIDVSGIGRITARTTGEFSAETGAPIFLTPDQTKLHRFDVTGKAIP